MSDEGTVDPMDVPPRGHWGKDRYDYIEIRWDGPDEQPPLPPWLTADWMPCPDCRANAFFTWVDNDWHVTIAHDDGCPTLRRIESEGS